MSGLESIGRAILSLALVVGLMWLLGRWARGRGRRKGRAREGVEVLARQQLNRNASIAVVQVLGRAMVLGVTETQVTHLGDIEMAAVEAGQFDLETVELGALERGPVQISSVAAPPLVAFPAPTGASQIRASQTRSTQTRSTQTRSSKNRAPRSPRRSLEGSALSLTTWSQALNVLRDRTVRH